MGSEVSKAPELLPCPFCGGKANIEQYGNSRMSTIVSCGDCGATLENGEEWGHGRSWNTRADLHADLLRAADELADAFGRTLDGGGIVGRGWAMKCRSALSAYKKAKGKLG